MATPSSSPTLLLAALMEHRVSAQVTDLDHYRIHGGMAVETDFIITVKPGSIDDTNSVLERRTDGFEAFKLNKTYSAFRTLALQLKKAADATTSNLSKRESLPSKVRAICRYCELVVHLIDSQRTQYLGKVNYSYVKALAKQRSRIINDALEATLSNFPDEVDSHPLLQEVAQAIETFLLTDFCYEEDEVEEVSPHHHHHRSSSGGSGTFTSALKIFATPNKRKENYQTSSPKRLSAGSSRELSLTNVLRKQEHDEPDEEGVEIPADEAADVVHSMEAAPKRLRTVKSPVVPYTRRVRRSVLVRALDDNELNEVGEDANLLLDDDRPQSELVPSYSHPVPVTAHASTFVAAKWDEWVGNNPTMFVLIGVLSIYILRQAAQSTVRMDVDVFLLVIFASYCLGLHTPRPAVSGIDKPAPGQLRVSFVPQQDPDRSGHKLLRRSMAIVSPKVSVDMTTTPSKDRPPSVATIAEDSEDEPEVMTIGPMARFPVGAPLGSHDNCWSEPNPADFLVRGPKYLVDHKKTPSGDFLFPVRGVDLFLTDACPENVGSNSSVFGGHLRDVPTFIVNFRLPWGVLLFYYEIADRFVPFLRARYEADFDKSQLPSLDDMSPGDRTACRYLLGDDAHKNHTFKIVPVVVEGPWIVKSVVGGKPAIIGNKLPVKYTYQRQEGKLACYLEADLDIVSSAAARGILSVARTYTQVLTLDLGFVVQGNSDDELPEQMLVGTRLHGINPLTAPPLPPMKDLFLGQVDSVDEDSVSGIHAETRQ